MKSNPIRSMLGPAVLLALLAAACGGPSATGGAPDTSGLAPLHAQATLDVWAAVQATAAASSQAATRSAGEATRASSQATADAQAAATAAVVAAWDDVALQKAQADARHTVEAGDFAVAAEATATIRAAEATATSDAAVMAFMQREAEVAMREREAEAARDEMWNRLLPWLVVAGVLIAAGVALAVAGSYLLVRVRRSRPQPMGTLGFTVWGPEGPLAITAPAPRPQLTAGATPPVNVTPAATAPPDLEVFRPSAQGHALVAGPTDSGKSTALRAILAARQNVVVLDPHWDGKDWGESRVIGGARDFEAIRAYMEWMTEELQARYRARLDGRQTFEPHTVAIDEMPAIIDDLGRAVAATWRQWLREGRKVGLFLVVSTQSTRVETLGIKGEGDLLSNFNVTLVLGKTAVEEYRHLVTGMERPAVLHTVAGARPVGIPNVPAPVAPPRASEVAQANEAAAVPPPQATLPAVYATTEWPTRDEAPIDPSRVSPRDRQRIVDEYKRTLVIRQVQLKLFPSYTDDGGQAGQVIRQVLSEEGMIERDAPGRFRPTAKALGLDAGWLPEHPTDHRQPSD